MKKMIDRLPAKLSCDVLLNDDATPAPSEIRRTFERIIALICRMQIDEMAAQNVHHHLFNFDVSRRPRKSYKIHDEISSRVLRNLKEVHADKHLVIR